VESIIKKQIDKARQYFKPSSASTEVETLRKELCDALQTIQQLKDEIALKGLPPFCEKVLNLTSLHAFSQGYQILAWSR